MPLPPRTTRSGRSSWNRPGVRSLPLPIWWPRSALSRQWAPIGRCISCDFVERLRHGRLRRLAPVERLYHKGVAARHVRGEHEALVRLGAPRVDAAHAHLAVCGQGDAQTLAFWSIVRSALLRAHG
eukprot:6963913-Prymnesium_polylepis.2